MGTSRWSYAIRGPKSTQKVCSLNKRKDSAHSNNVSAKRVKKEEKKIKEEKKSYKDKPGLIKEDRKLKKEKSPEDKPKKKSPDEQKKREPAKKKKTMTKAAQKLFKMREREQDKFGRIKRLKPAEEDNTNYWDQINAEFEETSD